MRLYKYRFEIELSQELTQAEQDQLELALAAQLEDSSLMWKSKLHKIPTICTYCANILCKGC